MARTEHIAPFRVNLPKLAHEHIDERHDASCETIALRIYEPQSQLADDETHIIPTLCLPQCESTKIKARQHVTNMTVTAGNGSKKFAFGDCQQVSL